MRPVAAVADPAATRERLTERFLAAQEHYRNKLYEKAVAGFAAVEAGCLPGLASLFVMAKVRRGASFMALKRWGDALGVFDELAAEIDELPGFDRTRLPDRVATIYWSRSVCLEQLGRMTEACARIADLIEEVGSGTTSTQRNWVASAYLLQARAAQARGRFDEAHRAIDAAITQCSGTDEPELRSTLHDAEQMKQALQARVRPAR